jgi:ABC-type multidrug transport system fused ATPase/permease subunit
MIKSLIYILKAIWNTFKKYRLHVIALVVFGFLSAILEGIGINATIPLLSFFVSGNSVPTDFISRTIYGLFGFLGIPFAFRYLLLFILSLFLLRAVALAIFGYLRGWITADFLTEESEKMLSLTFSAKWPFLLKQQIGTLQNTLVRDIQRASSFLETVSQIIQSFSGFAMYLLIAVNISPVTMVLTLASGTVLLFFVRPFLGRTRVASREMAQTEKTLSQYLTEHLLGMKVVKASGVERQALRRGSSIFHALRRIYIRLALTRSISGSVFQPFALVFIIILFSLTYHTPGFSIFSFAATLYLIQKIFTYLESGQNAFHAVGEYLPYAENVNRFKKLLEEHREVGERGVSDFTVRENIAFEHVSFSYSDTAHILHDVSFVVPRGEITALVGPSGSGKTTTADLLLRLFTPTKGEITVDGVAVTTIDTEAWRKHISYVPQDSFLFNDSIKENIRFYNQTFSQEDIVAAARQANIHDFIMTLPETYDTVIGDHGVLISGGQRQRIALARALVRRPQLLIASLFAGV